LQRHIDQAHAVIAADRKEIRIAVIFVDVGLHELVVQRRAVRVIVVAGGDDADGNVAHAGQGMFVGDFGLPQHFDLLRIDAAFRQGLAERARLGAPGDHDENALRVEVLGALHIGGEVRALHRHADGAENLAARFLEAFMECRFGVDARTKVGDECVSAFKAVLRRPSRERLVELRNGERNARDVV
jgi:hypothetical protein